MPSTLTKKLPSDPGEFTPEEAKAWQESMLLQENFATDDSKAGVGRAIVEGILSETSEKMQNLWRRWRATHYNLRGNTLEIGGPEDVHSPELYKIIETVVPRVVEQVLGQEHFFGMIPRRPVHENVTTLNEEYVTWLMDQANLTKLVAPATRDMLVTQIAPVYVTWETKIEDRTTREVTREMNFETGKIERTVKTTRKPEVVYCGVRFRLIDPYDFIIHTKATNVQDALYVGHRAWLTIDEIRRMAPAMGWTNLDKLTEGDSYKSLTPNAGYNTRGRDPTATSGLETGVSMAKGVPGKVEVVFIYTRASLDDGKTYKDYRIAVAGARVVLELRENPEEFRPYALGNVSGSGHETFGQGPFDNAIRLNQQLDAYLQIIARGSKLAGMPLVFVDDAGDLPPSLLRAQPFRVYSGVGNVRFTQIPDGLLRAAPMMIQMWQRGIEETAGSFRIQMGQQDGGTATEATIALQEGNRRMFGIVLAVADLMQQLLDLSYRYARKYSSEDVEFPVLGKRALQLRRSHMQMTPADFLDDVKFTIVGLKNARNYGLKIHGLRMAMDSTANLIAANPTAVDQPAIIHDVFSEFVGPEEAARYVKLPTPIDRLYSQEQEMQMLLEGYDVEVDPDDDDEEHLRVLEPYRVAALDESNDMHPEVRRVIMQQVIQHTMQAGNKRAREKAVEGRMPDQVQMMQLQRAGGQVSPETGRASPRAGAFESAVALNEEGVTPGPEQAPRQMTKTARRGRPLAQWNNGDVR